jgi:hypothetical protein
MTDGEIDQRDPQVREQNEKEAELSLTEKQQNIQAIQVFFERENF